MLVQNRTEQYCIQYVLEMNEMRMAGGEEMRKFAVGGSIAVRCGTEQ
jgi:hypothetical protein